MTDKDYMLRAIELAKKGFGFVNPNPAVGAVIVKDGRIISEGYHHEYGNLHAERDAFSRLTESAEGATIYVTLEPCCHTGKQPPCTEAIIENKIKRVVVGSRDPNPKVGGKGCQQLRNQGIEVVEDFLREECDEINQPFFHFIQTQRPYVVMKYAMTLDGKIATHTGESKWITGEIARRHVHRTRAKFSAILAGIGTILADDPMLNARIDGENPHQPVRIIVDSKLRIPMDSNIVKSAGEYRTVVAYNPKAAEEYSNHCNLTLDDKKNLLNKAGIELIDCGSQEGEVDICKITEWMSSQNLDSLLIEGGGQIHEAALKAGVVNYIMAYIAPKIFGGKDAKTPVEGMGFKTPTEGISLSVGKITKLGEDILVEGKIQD